MNTHKRKSPRRGVTIVTVMVFLAFICVICASLLTVVTFEKKLTRRTAAVAELKTSTDTLLNYAAAQARGNTALLPTASRASTIKMLPDDFFSKESDSQALVVPASQELYVSPLTRMVDDTTKLATRFYINPNAPINRNDDLRDKNVYRDLCLIASKAAVKDPSSPAKEINEYAVMVLERRFFSVFNYLAFFDVANFRISNPGSNIILDGPIQSNQGIQFDVQGQSSIVQIQSTLQTPGTLNFSGYTSAGKFMMADGTFNTNGTPVLKDMLKPGTTALRQSSDGSSFNTFALTDTKGMLKTGAVGGSDIQLDGLNYVDDSSASIPANFKISNNRRIDPPNPALRDSTDPAYADARVAETAKTAYEASLYTYVDNSGDVMVFTNEANAESYKAASNKTAWKSANTSKYIDPAETSGFVNMPYVERYNDGGTDYTSASKNTDLARGAIFDAQQKKTVAMVDLDLGALSTKVKSGAIKLANGTSWNTTGTTGWNGVMYVDVANPTGMPTSVPVKDKASGYYIGPVTTTNPVTGVSTTVTKPDSSITADTAIKAPLPSLNITGTAKAWNDGSSISDTGLTGVRIKNATTVPSALIGDPGFTLATNTATYTVGSVNADGNISTGTTSLQDDQSSATSTTAKVPAAIFSDKNVVLSNDFSNLSYDLDLYVKKPSSRPSGMAQSLYNNWPFTGPAPSSSTYDLGNKNGGSGEYYYQRNPNNRSGSARVMELSVAFMVGDDASTNKGIHTILSYLQPFDSSNDTLRMRGSIIGIFKSRYFNAAAGSFNDYYVAPQRTFGYSSLLKSGKMPPASPTISSYRRMRQFTISPADYKAIKTGTNTVDDWLAIVGKKY